MTEKERLIELLNGAVNHYAFITRENLADYLLSHGVKIPVRCEECQNFSTESEMKYMGCDGMCRSNSLLVKKDDYCSYGKREDNG